MRESLIVLLLGMLVACGRAEDTRVVSAGTTREPLIYAVNYPLAWAAEQLAGEWAEVKFPMTTGGDPAFWQPGPEQLAGFQRADLILLNGAGYARWLSRASLPENRRLDTSRAFAERYITLDSGPVHSHGPEGDHSHAELAFTVWLDLGLYQEQVQAIAAALTRMYPDQAAGIEVIENALLEQLLTLHREMQGLGKAYNSAPVLYSHPVYQYFERAYGFNGRALHWEPDQFPAEEEWAALQSLLSVHPAGVMLWEDEPLSKTRERLRGLGIEVVVVAPMGNRPSQGDFLTGMSDNVERLGKTVDAHVD